MNRFSSIVGDMPQTRGSLEEVKDIRVENCIGFSKVPLGIAGPLRLNCGDRTGLVHAPIATYEPTLIASCSRGCKAFNASGGMYFRVLGDGMSRAPVFTFPDPGDAVTFSRELPALRDEFSGWAEATSTHVKLQEMRPAVIGSQVHVLCTYTCGDAAGQNMVTKATQYACDMLREHYGDQFSITDFFIEGQMASDKKPSWSHVQTPRGVQVMAWGTISADACEAVFGCTTRRLYHAQRTLKEGGIRNGQFGSNINTANIVAAMFIATGQDPASIVDAAWCHLTTELDESTDALTMTMFCPSLPVGVIGGGTGYATQHEALRLLGCASTNERHRLAGIISSFALALDASTSAAIATNTFTASHMRLARGEKGGEKQARL